jgi:hypothetical protein
MHPELRLAAVKWVVPGNCFSDGPVNHVLTGRRLHSRVRPAVGNTRPCSSTANGTCSQQQLTPAGCARSAGCRACGSQGRGNHRTPRVSGQSMPAAPAVHVAVRDRHSQDPRIRVRALCLAATCISRAAAGRASLPPVVKKHAMSAAVRHSLEAVAAQQGCHLVCQLLRLLHLAGRGGVDGCGGGRGQHRLVSLACTGGGRGRGRGGGAVKGGWWGQRRLVGLACAGGGEGGLAQGRGGLSAVASVARAGLSPETGC